MTLDELQKLCDEATQPDAFAFTRFANAARRFMPLLIDVAREAQQTLKYSRQVDWWWDDLANALAKLRDA